jgi:hypothetical protein
MRTSIIILGVFLILSSVATGQTSRKSARDTTGSAIALSRSRAAAEDLLSTLKGVLSEHMTSGGPVRAITACSDTAQVLTEQVEHRHRLSIRRVSEKWRNGLDEPDPYERNVLRRFEVLSQEDDLGPATEYTQITLDDSIRVFRYMRPIVIQPVCLSCHGPIDRLHPEVLRVLEERYPDDIAVDYKDGDMRGAVTVKVELE